MKTTKISINFTAKYSKKSEMIVIFAAKDKQLLASGLNLDNKAGGWIKHNIDNDVNFKGDNGQVTGFPMPMDSEYKRVIVVGLGDVSKLTLHDIENAGGKILIAARSANVEEICMEMNDFGNFNESIVAARISYGINLAAYEFNKYKSEPDEKDKNIKLAKVNLITKNFKEAYEAYEDLDSVVQGVYLARDLINECPNALYPSSFVKIIKDEFKDLDVSISVIDEKKMDKLGMGAILAVGKGSSPDRQPRMVVIKYNGGNKKDAPIAFVGKGVTFDTGGISLKPGPGMEDMKMDMGGAAGVIGLMKALAARNAKVNVIAAVGLAENMPSGEAYRPGDIITSYKGKTIEILNTDAEGRLVLADTLTYVQEKHKPHTIIDIATLTGSIMIGLGVEYCGAFSNDNELWNRIDSAGDITGEKYWRMPLDKSFRKEVESEIADLKNLGGKFGGACTAAAFIENFIDEDVKWSHLDIAGVTLGKRAQTLSPKGGVGFSVRSLNQMVKDYYEAEE